jgi:nitrite reductase/ring-hydroxylating ferredoxin subunit
VTTPDDHLVDVDTGSPVGTVVQVTRGDTARVAIRHATGWVEIDDRCPHAGCPFSHSGEVVDDTVLVCNCHGSEFDLVTGALLAGPATEGIEPLPLVVRDGRLCVTDE